jgi:mRNA interferase MazF
MKKGDIILIPFPFTDHSGLKTRPALVLASSESDIIVAFITLQSHNLAEYDVIVEPDPNNGLNRRSFIRLNKLATIDKQLALGRLGTVSSLIIPRIDLTLAKLFLIGV